MNTATIRHALSEIDRLQIALSWLEQYGPKITKESGEQVSYRPNFAGSCAGSDEAAQVLCAMMRNRLPDLILEAVDDCKNTIEIHRETIRCEAV